jgi:hypothetical protein
VHVVEDLFLHHLKTVECKVSGWQLPDNTVMHLTKRHFINKISTTRKKSSLQRCAMCTRHRKWGTQSTSV